MKLVAKDFFLADVSVLGDRLRFGYKQFPLADLFYLGGHFRLESSCIQVNMVNYLCFSLP
jgi:hypothetical protein